MPHCPSCGKGGFNSHKAIARHMGQPRSGCSSWLDNLVNICEDLLGRSRDGHNSSGTTSTGDRLGGLDEDNQWVSNDKEMFDRTQEDSQSSPIEFFPGAAQMFASGPTFLNRFDADEFSLYRSSNIYYPFASSDWQLGSWLLCSGLSMGVINAFLSLDLVCPYHSDQPQLTIKLRSKHYPYPSPPQTSSTNELSCYPLAHDGNHRKSPHCTQPSDQSYSTGVTLLNLYSISSTVPIFRM